MIYRRKKVPSMNTIGVVVRKIFYRVQFLATASHFHHLNNRPKESSWHTFSYRMSATICFQWIENYAFNERVRGKHAFLSE